MFSYLLLGYHKYHSLLANKLQMFTVLAVHLAIYKTYATLSTFLKCQHKCTHMCCVALKIKLSFPIKSMTSSHNGLKLVIILLTQYFFCCCWVFSFAILEDISLQFHKYNENIRQFILFVDLHNFSWNDRQF